MDPRQLGINLEEDPNEDPKENPEEDPMENPKEDPMDDEEGTRATEYQVRVQVEEPMEEE